jgi:hypothetical protein
MDRTLSAAPIINGLIFICSLLSCAATCGDLPLRNLILSLSKDDPATAGTASLDPSTSSG